MWSVRPRVRARALPLPRRPRRRSTPARTPTLTRDALTPRVRGGWPRRRPGQQLFWTIHERPRDNPYSGHANALVGSPVQAHHSTGSTRVEGSTSDALRPEKARSPARCDDRRCARMSRCVPHAQWVPYAGRQNTPTMLSQCGISGCTRQYFYAHRTGSRIGPRRRAGPGWPRWIRSDAHYSTCPGVRRTDRHRASTRG